MLLKRKKMAATLLLLFSIAVMSGCSSSNGKTIEGSYYCPEKDSNAYVLEFARDGTVDTYYSGKGTYSIESDGTFKIDISVIHGTGTYNSDGSIDFNTTDRVSYHYIPESQRPEDEPSTEETFNATLMLDRMPYEYNKDLIKASELQTDDDGSEAIAEVREKGINGSNKYFENENYYLILMLSGYTDTNCAVYYAYLIPKEGKESDFNTYYASFYFYNSELHTSLEEFTGIKNGINFVAGSDIFEYSFQDVMTSLSTLKAQM